ncbi:MAG: acetoin utilization protein AcuC [Gammaproteobacteria bacterium]|nr:acetoin utilization protein AcuC [Gammaproteobacteria bacterium]
MKQTPSTCVYLGTNLASYGFGNNHPFGPQRHNSFSTALRDLQLDQQLCLREPVSTNRQIIELFHEPDYVDRVIEQSKTGSGYLDYGDTPAFKGVYEATCYVVGSVIDAIDQLLKHEFKHAFVPIAGLHHARRDSAAGFCVFNDCGIAIEYLKTQKLKQILYVDIDAHHGDGVFYAFEDDPAVIFADIHESGQYLYPGTGHSSETGRGEATGLKLNIPMKPGSTDNDFLIAWQQLEKFVSQFKPEFILLQCGVDSMAGDPITHLKYSAQSHAFATQALINIANLHCEGKLLVMGGGGYNHQNIALGWTTVVQTLIDQSG